jgi:hypothetical protein
MFEGDRESKLEQGFLGHSSPVYIEKQARLVVFLPGSYSWDPGHIDFAWGQRWCQVMRRLVAGGYASARR